MCWTASAYVKKLTAAPDGTPITRSEKMLLFVLADYYNADEHGAWASMEALATDAMLSVRQAQRLCRSLVTRGVLGLEPRIDPLYGQRSNWYTLPTLDKARDDMMSPRVDTEAEEIFSEPCCSSQDLTRGDMVSPLVTTRGDIAMSPPYEPPDLSPLSLPTGESSPQGKPVRPRAAHKAPKKMRKCPEEFVPAQATRDWAAAHCPEVDFDDALAEMREHEFKDGRIDWNRVLRVWIKKELKLYPSYYRQQSRASPLTRAEKRALDDDRTNRELEELALGINTHNSVWAPVERHGERVQSDPRPRPESRLLNGGR